MKNQKYNGLIISFVFGVCLLFCQPAYSTEKISLCWSSFVDSVGFYFKTRLQILKDTPPQYVSGSVLKQNDIASIRGALNLQNGEGAAIVNVNTFTLEIAEKMRRAIQDASSKNERLPRHTLPEKPLYFHFHARKRNFVPELILNRRGSSFDRDWKDFKAWLQEKTQVISSEEIDQFRKEIDEYIDQIKQMILEVDGQNIELNQLIIRTEKGRFVSGHTHGPRLQKYPAHFPADFVPDYITASIAPIGLSTFYTNQQNTRGVRILSYSGDTVILSEEDRIEKMKEPGSFPFHGTPGILKERLILLFGFKIPE